MLDKKERFFSFNGKKFNGNFWKKLKKVIKNYLIFFLKFEIFFDKNIFRILEFLEKIFQSFFDIFAKKS